MPERPEFVGRPKRPDFEKIKQNNSSFASFGKMPAPMVSGPRIERPNIETPWIDNAVDNHFVFKNGELEGHMFGLENL